MGISAAQSAPCTSSSRPHLPICCCHHGLWNTLACPSHQSQPHQQHYITQSLAQVHRRPRVPPHPCLASHGPRFHELALPSPGWQPPPPVGSPRTSIAEFAPSFRIGGELELLQSCDAPVDIWPVLGCHNCKQKIRIPAKVPGQISVHIFIIILQL